MAELDIAAFLRARYDETEFSDWHERTCQTHQKMPSNSPLGLGGSPLSCNCRVPAFVLADVAAKRQIIAMHRRTATRAGDRLIEHCSCQDDWSTIFGRYWPCDTLSLLALPYAGHPDYDESWKP